MPNAPNLIVTFPGGIGNPMGQMIPTSGGRKMCYTRKSRRNRRRNTRRNTRRTNRRTNRRNNRKV